MAEPVEFGARVMTDDGLAVRAWCGAAPWLIDGEEKALPWHELRNPRPPDEPVELFEVKYMWGGERHRSFAMPLAEARKVAAELRGKFAGVHVVPAGAR